MRIAKEVAAAAARIIDGDDSEVAGAALERALHAHHPFEEELEDLVEALAFYAPSRGKPYLNHPQLCEAIRQSKVGGAVGC